MIKDAHKTRSQECKSVTDIGDSYILSIGALNLQSAI